PSVRLIGGPLDTFERNAKVVEPAGVIVSTPFGRNVFTPMLIPLSSGTGRFHVMSQFGDSVGNAQAEASIASAKIPVRGRRIRAWISWLDLPQRTVRGGGGNCYVHHNRDGRAPVNDTI